MTLREFIQKINRDRDLTFHKFSWNEEFNRARYTYVIRICDTNQEFTEILEWATAEIGLEHFTYHGEYWWFENKDDAMLFKLVW
jgi:hypothetical protein